MMGTSSRRAQYVVQDREFLAAVLGPAAGAEITHNCAPFPLAWKSGDERNPSTFNHCVTCAVMNRSSRLVVHT